jgi:carbonic anhydrase/acetyltransferase-like protein (isoleucine patch superfamily)
MDVRAIVITGVLGESPSSVATDSVEAFSGVPHALLPVLGRPVLHYVADRLKNAGIDSISVLNAADSSLPLIEEAGRSDFRWKNVPAGQVWRAAEEEFDDLVQAGAEMVIVLRLGAYAEVEIDPFLQYHLDQRNHTTQVLATDGPLDFFVLCGSRRNDARFLLRNKLSKMRVQTQPYLTTGYVNRLQSAGDLRRLAVDSFLRKTSIPPQGQQIRPGVWVGEGAKIDRNVRLVAPCYVGPHARVRAGSLITRGSSLEHHTVVDRGTVVEASTLLPLSYLGAGLDLTHSVVGFKRIASVKYSAQLEIEDTSLVSVVPGTSVLRTLNHAVNLVAFLPRQMLAGVFGSRKIRKSQPALDALTTGFDGNAVARTMTQDRQQLTASVMREYGNQ